MNINNIFIKNFKNYTIKEFNFDRFNIIRGPNASGKTNLLEAIYIILNSKPFYKKINTLANNKQKSVIISATVNTDHMKKSIYFEVNNNKKIAKINSERANIKIFKKNFPNIIFSFKSFIEFNNKSYLFSLLDQNTFINNKNLLNELIEYSRIIKIKKIILKSQKIDDVILKLKNKQLMQLINSISQKRKESSEKINYMLHKYIKYFFNKHANLLFIQKDINEDMFNKEIQQRKLLVTLNKDNIKIYINSNDIFSNASLSEKKIILFCIIYGIIKSYSAVDIPIVLIDDLEGDLDSKTKGIIFDMIEKLDNQIFLTSINLQSEKHHIIELGGH